MISKKTYQIFYTLAEPRKVEFCYWYLMYGEKEAKDRILKAITVPKKQEHQRIISAYAYDQNIELVFSNDIICIQSNSKKAIRRSEMMLFVSGEIFYKVKNNSRNTQVFKFQNIYSRITGYDCLHPINPN